LNIERAFGNHVDASRLFVYKTTRNLLGDGDTGAYPHCDAGTGDVRARQSVLAV
jgi:hypothetical protein